MDKINAGDETIDIPRSVLRDLLACARVGSDGADDAIGSDRADAVSAMLDRLENAIIS